MAIVIDKAEFERRLRSHLEVSAEQFQRDMPNRACCLGYNEGINAALREVLRLLKELGR